jgi:hypothetical protein
MATIGSKKSKVFWGITLAFFVAFLFQGGKNDASSPAPAAAVAAVPVETAPAQEPVVAGPTPTELAAAEAERVAAAEQVAHDQKYGFTCLSLWDGSHDGFVAAVKQTLNDPDSFEHDETKTWPVNAEGRNTILMNFRAKNAFGGTIRVKASGSFDNKTCEDVQVDQIE